MTWLKFVAILRFTVLKKLAHLTMIGALICAIGGHWAILQSVAWVGMLTSYARVATLAEAIEKTFDGKHPCRLCKVIKQAGDDEKQQRETQPVQTSAKMDLGLVWQRPAFDFSRDREVIPSPNTVASVRSDEPPKPRPRTA